MGTIAGHGLRALQAAWPRGPGARPASGRASAAPGRLRRPQSPGPQVSERGTAAPRARAAWTGPGSGYAIPYAISVVAPTSAYLILHMAFGLSSLWSLVVGAAVAAAATLYDSMRRRRLNIVGIFVLTDLATSAVLIAVTHSPRVLLFKPAVSIGIIGLGLLATCGYGRPMGYLTTMPAITRGDSKRTEAYEYAWATSAQFRLRLRVMTAAWGIAFLVDTAIRVYLAATSSITEAVVVPHVIGAVLIAAAVAVTAIQARAVQRIVNDLAGRGLPGPQRATTKKDAEPGRESQP
jgi:hypothetical protein